jgi:hypothetical protein
VAKGSLLPENAVGGGAVPDGDYLIKDIVAQMFDYGGRVEELPAISVLYNNENGDFEQYYSAGKGAKLIDPPDGKRFEVIGKNSNAWAWIGSMLGSGFPKASVDDDVTVFKGSRVTVVNVAQPKRPGIKDAVEGKTIPLVTKVLALPGEKAAPVATRPTQAGRAPAASTSTARPIAAASTAVVDGEPTELDAAAIVAIQQIVATAPDMTITRLKLGTAVMLTLAKAKDPNMAAVKKLATDAAWLTANAELGGWVFDADTLVLQQ